ncbi:hypothetical protein BBP40_001319 [Aspergillus hancockii]|nr:hypothetical protein BBP40_001319 [Aspergillus hancockii]
MLTSLAREPDSANVIDPAKGLPDFHLPIYFQNVDGVSAIGSGVHNLPFILAVSIFTVVSGTLISVTGYPAPFLVGGAAVATVGCGVFYTFNIGAGTVKWIRSQILAGVGNGLGVQVPMFMVQVSADAKDVAATPAILIGCHTIGGAFMQSGATAALAYRLLIELPNIALDIDPGAVAVAGATELKPSGSKASGECVLPLKSLAPGLVAVFVGGTSGISLSTALAFACHTVSPKIYLVGRSQSAAETAVTSMKTIHPSAQPTFLQTDISLLRKVDNVCAKIEAKEKKLNLLFMTPGYMTLNGRDETTEGLDRKFVLHYYARMRFISNLLPLLLAGAKGPDTRLSRVISILDPLVSVRAGGSGTLDFSDLSLKHTFSLQKCGAHASLMGDFFLEDLAQLYQHTSFVHAYPSGVATGLLRELPVGHVLSAVLGRLLSPFMVPIEESGERHLFAATSGKFPSKADSDGTKGSGCYWLNWDGEVFPANKKLGKTRDEGAVEKVMQHTNEVFKRVCEAGKTYP